MRPTASFRNLCRTLLSAATLLVSQGATAQVTGGQYAFEFLRMSNSPHVSALGGISVANPDNDISLALQNPALMRPGLHNELQLNYNSYYADIRILNLQYGYYVPKINTAFAMGVQYLNYGTFTQTDNIGNIYGDVKATDYALSFAASRSYQQHWRYGATLKFANSTLAQFNATAAVMDVGINYYDTCSLWDIGAVAKNMGVMIDRYNDNIPAEPVPFDLQIGVSKRFRHMPLRLFTTIHHLYEWDVRYNNPADITASNILGTTDSSSQEGSHFVDKLFRHFIFGAELTLGKRIILTGSYNFMRRKELALDTQPGISGFAFGVGVNLSKFQVHYGRSYYNAVGAYNEIGFTMQLNKLFATGTCDNSWNKVYEDWQ
jgi:hypothetical protein